MPKVNGRDIFETKPWLNDDPQNIEQYSGMVSASAPSGTIEISANGEYDVSEYATADVQVEGGGSSDFSTAEITVTLPADSDAAISVPTIDGPPNMQFLWAATITSSGTKTTALYKGQVMCELVNYEDKTVTVSGDIESMGGSSYIITGDCTITIASA